MAKLWLLVVCCIALGGCTTFNDLVATSELNGDACRNGKRDVGELGVDCGGTCPGSCDGESCTADTECHSAKCTDGTCAASAGKKCGVGVATPCNDGERCGVDADCTGDYCDDTCKAPAGDVHSDGRRNGGESGKDCGGTSPTPCPQGESCKVDADCAGLCKASKCDAPSATDGKKNADETDVDCGGAAAPKCALDKTCIANGDCELDACTAGKCVTPTATDGVQNGGETAIDCGGNGVSAGGVTYQAPRCTVDKACVAGTDCMTGACSPAKKCAVPSCATAETSGVATCGQGETGNAGAVHDSCCTSLVLPTRTGRRLDKYEITAGRFRAFLAAVGPNVRAWAAKFATDHPTSQLAQHLAAFPVLRQLYPAVDLDDALSLTSHMSIDIDNYDGIRGCYNGPENYSANTYWLDNAHQAAMGLPNRILSRAESDEKPLNCAMPIMFDAFCAWDGGELAVNADYADVWPTAQPFPWGPTNLCTEGGGLGQPGLYKPCDAYNWCNGPFKNGGFECQNLALTTTGEPGVFYEYPRNKNRAIDNSPLIGAPGRFPKDLTALKSANGQGWYDLFANLGEYTGDWLAQADPNGQLSTFCDTTATPAAGATACTRQGKDAPGTLYRGIPQIGMVGSTWEGHQYGPLSAQSGLPATFQYGKMGARCARLVTAY